MSLVSFPRLLLRMVSTVLALALVFTPSFGYSLAAASADREAGTLSVSTDPDGAAVYLDGKMAGHTPLDLEGIPAGDHRVRVVKTGFLENSRIVGVGPNRASAVTVKLTRLEEGASATAAPRMAPGGGLTPSRFHPRSAPSVTAADRDRIRDRLLRHLGHRLACHHYYGLQAAACRSR